MKIILAHRGVIDENKENKENTLGSLKAIKKYLNTTNIKFGIEFDINMTLDIKLVLYHDECIKGTRHKISNLTYAELKLLDDELTLLEEVLEEFDGTDYILDIEFKEYPMDKIKFCDIFIELVNKYKRLNYFTSSFDKFIVDYLRNKNIISYRLINKEDLFSVINTTYYKDDVKFITHYTNINFTNNIKGIYTLFDKEFNINVCSNIFCRMSNIEYFITDDIEKTIDFTSNIHPQQ